MGIHYLEQDRIFKLDTPGSSYLLCIVDQENFVGHIYYGKKIRDHKVGYLLRTAEPPYIPSKNNRDRITFLDSFPMEYPTHGLGDYRESCISIRTAGGHTGLSLQYLSHEILPGKPKLQGLPSIRGEEADCTTLILTCEDKPSGLLIKLLYTVFEDLDVITRSVQVINQGKEGLCLTRVFSACLDMDNKDFEAVSLHGSWAGERHITVSGLNRRKSSVESIRGESSHQDHPFMALQTRGANQDCGEVYAMHFVYSGNFKVQAQVDQFDSVRMVMGIHPEDFCWKLEPGEAFQAPEAVLTYSDRGLGGMTHTFHDLYRNHLISGIWKNTKRPVLINNWEATYFDFDTEKILAIARSAASAGIEMLVLDDGWFGKRNSDNCALGDWVVNEEKLPGGLKFLADEINRLRMKFGIWMEPEMVSPDSDLYRAHPDWAIAIPERTPSLGRCQYVLDLSRIEVRDHIYECIAGILRSAHIEYVKWDMNRYLSDLGSAKLPADRMGELYHRYVLGLYELQDRMMKEFPDLLLENCSAGGARFDPGMLYYSPQIWCSDDTDALERLMIQEGTALLYPLSTMGAHVSDCPNHMTGRTIPFETRGIVALAGTFGYELDITMIPEEDRKQIPGQIAMYHKYHDLIREGDYYRIDSYLKNHYYDCYGVVSKDKEEALFTYIQVLSRAYSHSRKIYLKGLHPDYDYQMEDSGEVYSGDTLMHAGLLMLNLEGDFKGKLIYLKKVN